jgi:hypothetical protein
MTLSRSDRRPAHPRCDSCQHREAAYTDPAAVGIHPHPLTRTGNRR